MTLTRRSFIQAPAALGIAAAAGFAQSARMQKIKVGVTDWNLRQSARIEAIEMAAGLGFDGLEISLGRKLVDDKLPLDSAEVQDRYLAESKKHNIRLAGTCCDILHVNYLKNDKLGQKWVADGVAITKRLGARNMLLPFFGKGGLETHAEMDYVGDALRDLGKEAEKAGVILALENTISAKDNLRIMERSKSKAVQVYYDVGNSTWAGFNIFDEMRFLGRRRISQIHLKDKGYLGEGSIPFPAVMATIGEIGYEGFVVLETNSPSNSVPDDMRRNLQFVRKLMATL